MTGKVPEIVSWGVSHLVVCVPEGYSQEQTEEFANRNHPSGYPDDWHMASNTELAKCSSRRGCVHIRLITQPFKSHK